MNKFDYLPQKHFGQHFLRDDRIIQKIVQAIAPQSANCLIEIGPGLGALTLPLLRLTNQLHVVERDRHIIPQLQANCVAHADRLIIHEMDALKFDFSSVIPAGQKARVVGNLPYNISTPLLFHCLSQMDLIEEMVFMVQKEVADRITASHSTAEYGRLSVMVQYHCHAVSLFSVGRQAFFPPPKVESAVIRLTPTNTYPPCQQDLLSVIVRDAFNQRRKTIRNSLKNHLSATALSSIGIDPNLRAENLTVLDYVHIAQHCTRCPL